MAIKTLTEKRKARATRVAEALSVFREKNNLSFEGIEAMLHHAGYEVSLSTIKRLCLGTHVPHGTTLAQVEAFLKNVGAPHAIAGRRVEKRGGKKKRRMRRWDSGSR